MFDWLTSQSPSERVITHLSPIIEHSKKISVQPRAIGSASVCVKADAQGKTRIERLRQSGASKLVFPHARRKDADVVLVNTAGGITGGDDFKLDIKVQTRAALTLTTQAAERAYRAQPDEVGQVNTKAHVHSGASFHWLPQELILFNRSALTRTLTVDLEQDARFLMVEPIAFGRAAMGETLSEVMFEDRIRVFRDGIPIYLDGMTLTGHAGAHLARGAIGGGAGAMASVVLVDQNAALQLDAVRALLCETSGASMIAQDIMAIRMLALDSFELRRTLIPILEHLSNNKLPTSWRL